MTYKLQSEYCDNIAFGITLKCESNYYLFNIFISGSKNQLEIFIYITPCCICGDPKKFTWNRFYSRTAVVITTGMSY